MTSSIYLYIYLSGVLCFLKWPDCLLNTSIAWVTLRVCRQVNPTPTPQCPLIKQSLLWPWVREAVLWPWGIKALRFGSPFSQGSFYLWMCWLWGEPLNVGFWYLSSSSRIYLFSSSLLNVRRISLRGVVKRRYKTLASYQSAVKWLWNACYTPSLVTTYDSCWPA
jgi:hypothetical protein